MAVNNLSIQVCQVEFRSLNLYKVNFIHFSCSVTSSPKMMVVICEKCPEK